MRRPIIGLEPCLLASPPRGANEAVVTMFIDTIVTLGEISRRRIWFDVLISQSTFNALCSLDRFPADNTFRDIITMSALRTVYSPKDITSLFYGLLDRSIRNTDAFGILDMLLDTDVTIDKEIEASIHDQALREAEYEFFACCALAAEGRLAAAAMLLPYVAHNLDKVNFSGSVLAVEPPNAVLIPEEQAISSRISVVRYGESFADYLDPNLLWRLAKNVDEYHLAITVAAYQVCKSAGRKQSWRDLARFHIGSDFVSSLHRNKASGTGPCNGVVLDTCARIVAGCPKNPVYPFRLTKSSASQPRTRKHDEAMARRTHVTSGHEGLRLMLWNLATSEFEFANIGPKWELEISEGIAKHCFSFDAYEID